ncbi:MAG: sulfotransferase [Rhodospirillales bacterium]|nr:sulfotransferase [Rhodospirillales bacterium]
MNREERRRQNKLNRGSGSATAPGLAGDARDLFEQARKLFEAGDLNEADELCQDVSASAPLDAQPFHLRALIQYRLGHLSKAGEMILEAITRNDDDPEIHANCGAIMNMLARYPEAEAASRHVIALNPRRADAYSNLGVALEMQGRLEEAKEACQVALELQPNYPEARINLGNLLTRTGDLIGAVEAYALVIEQAPDNPTARANMSVALLRLEEADAAETYAREALAINADYPEGLNALGTALVAQNRFAEAIDAFDAALALRPGSFEAANNRAAALLKNGNPEAAITAYQELIVDGKAPGEIFAGLGVALLASGLTDDAVQAFRDAIAVKPGLGDAYYNLACALGAGIEDDELAQMKIRVENPATALADQIALHFAIGEVADKCGDFENAFSAFTAGNSLRRQALNANEVVFDADAFDDEITAIIQAYPAGFQESLSQTRSHNEAPVFIVGMPRSGTTLVEQIVAAHAQVRSLGEAATFLGTAADMAMDQDAIEELDRQFSGDDQIKRIVDKTPFHFLSIAAIEQVFPRARIIHCRRGADDVAISCYFQNFISSHVWATDLADIHRYMDGEKKLMAHWKKASNLSILTMDYEELVTDPERLTHQLIDFLDLDWDDNCLNFHAAGGHSRSASNWQVRKPVYRSSVDRAASYLPYTQVPSAG